MRVQLLQAVEEQYFYGWGWMKTTLRWTPRCPLTGSNSATPQPVPPARILRHQQWEQGVDEADFVKTDGHHIYYLNGQTLHVIAVPEFGDLDWWPT